MESIYVNYMFLYHLLIILYTHTYIHVFTSLMFGVLPIFPWKQLRTARLSCDLLPLALLLNLAVFPISADWTPLQRSLLRQTFSNKTVINHDCSFIFHQPRQLSFATCLYCCSICSLITKYHQLMPNQTYFALVRSALDVYIITHLRP